jgi:general secretion pathway protein D
MNTSSFFCRTFEAAAVLAFLWGMGPGTTRAQQARPSWTPSRTTGAGRTTPAGRTTAGTAVGRDYGSRTEMGSAIVQIDPETRSLVVIADPETNEQIRRVIESLDQPKPQVLIKVLFVEVTHRRGLDLGTDLLHTSASGDVLENRVQTEWGVAAEMEGGFWRLLTDDFDATLRALAERGLLEVLSRPAILARNNQEAVIVVGEEVPFVTNSRVADNGSVFNTIEYADVGIILRVTPFILSNEQVELIVAPEISTLTERTIPVSETVRSPVIAKRQAETVVVTPNGRTVVIGGLMESQKTESVRKVPVLGDIPLLGVLFRRKVTEDIKKELVIFLTPYIVAQPGELDAMARAETQRGGLTSTLLESRSGRAFHEEMSLKEEIMDDEETLEGEEPRVPEE